MFGISAYLDNGASHLAASVNGEDVPAHVVQNAVVQQRNRLNQMFNGKIPPNFNGEALKTQALEQMINQVLVRQATNEGGFRASSEEVFNVISGMQAFQKDGKFDNETYNRVLASQRRNKIQFESDVRNSITSTQFSQSLLNTAFLPKEEAKLFLSLIHI